MKITENPIPWTIIETPKIGRKLPDTLSVRDIDTLVNAIDMSAKDGLGHRNRAMIETLYGCGLRVSELVNLKLSDLFFDEGFIKVTGKGNKQRLVPIAKSTQKHINLYKDEVRVHAPVVSEYRDTLFLNRRGKQLTRAMVFTIVRQLAEKAGIKKNHFTAYIQAFLCHAFVGARCRFESHTNDVGA